MSRIGEQLRADGWEVVAPQVFDEEEDLGDLELTSGEQLQALTEGFRLRLLSSIGRRPGSAKQLAERFDVPTTRLYHHLDLLEEHGFIQVVATRQSGARTERCYGRPRWRSIRPSAELAEVGDRSEMAAALRAMAEVVGVTLEESMRSGALRVPTTELDESPDVITWSTARLTRAQQDQFGEELTDLVQRISAASAANIEAEEDAGDLQSLMVYLVMAPDVLSPG